MQCYCVVAICIHPYTTLFYKASDGVRSANVTVMLTMLDCTPPIFSDDEYRFTVSENLTSGSNVGVVMATGCGDTVQHYIITAGDIEVFHLDCEQGYVICIYIQWNHNYIMELSKWCIL